MDLNTGAKITRSQVHEIPVTQVVIKAVEAMAECQGIQTLKIIGRNKQPLFPADWIAGVEYDDMDDYNDEDYVEPDDDEEHHYDYDEELDDEDHYDRIDQEDIDELLADPGPPKAPEEEDDPNPIAEPDSDDEPEQNVVTDDGTIIFFWSFGWAWISQ